VAFSWCITLAGRIDAPPQELNELDTLAQAPSYHFGTASHLADDRRDFRCPEIEPAVEVIDRVEISRWLSSG
jgi:hypothetical protein